jgi:hypothetical protein
MEKELEGYTEEEFQSLLSLMGLSSLFKATWEGWNAETPEDRFLIIEVYRKTITNGERVIGSHDE